MQDKSKFPLINKEMKCKVCPSDTIREVVQVVIKHVLLFNLSLTLERRHLFTQAPGESVQSTSQSAKPVTLCQISP